MTGLFKGKAVGQIDTLLIDGKPYTDKEIKEILKQKKDAS